MKPVRITEPKKKRGYPPLPSIRIPKDLAVHIPHHPRGNISRVFNFPITRMTRSPNHPDSSPPPPIGTFVENKGPSAIRQDSHKAVDVLIPTFPGLNFALTDRWKAESPTAIFSKTNELPPLRAVSRIALSLFQRNYELVQWPRFGVIFMQHSFSRYVLSLHPLL